MLTFTGARYSRQLLVPFCSNRTTFFVEKEISPFPIHSAPDEASSLVQSFEQLSLFFSPLRLAAHFFHSSTSFTSPFLVLSIPFFLKELGGKILSDGSLFLCRCCCSGLLARDRGTRPFFFFFLSLSRVTNASLRDTPVFFEY